jgi:hypothetical protein
VGMVEEALQRRHLIALHDTVRLIVLDNCQGKVDMQQ